MQEEAVKLFTSSQRWDLLNALLQATGRCAPAPCVAARFAR